MKRYIYLVLFFIGLSGLFAGTAAAGQFKPYTLTVTWYKGGGTLNDIWPQHLSTVITCGGIKQTDTYHVTSWELKKKLKELMIGDVLNGPRDDEMFHPSDYSVVLLPACAIPTTEPPTTAPPTTVAPTTEVPTTNAPTTSTTDIPTVAPTPRESTAQSPTQQTASAAKTVVNSNARTSHANSPKPAPSDIRTGETISATPRQSQSADLPNTGVTHTELIAIIGAICVFAGALIYVGSRYI